MKNAILITLLIVLGCGSLFAQVNIRQSSVLELEKVDSKNFHQVTIQPESFTLEFEGKELMVCAGLTEDLFLHTKAETDINADFNSYFFIFKFLAMEGNADYLPIGPDEAASLNETHGAKITEEGKSTFTVNSLQVSGEKKPISAFDRFFMALWNDQNKDQFIDKNELLHLKVVVQ
ncbi:hypothetical protein [uncultured Eudoraea sp.]|uniref:hypothetical protein n=1 Tax=uncultured Eudoraea sp. TaxID=1035614 RepID=UPI00262AC681|nr:hypothetical protein [uncultured Eudoraea sp.]